DSPGSDSYVSPYSIHGPEVRSWFTRRRPTERAISTGTRTHTIRDEHELASSIDIQRSDAVRSKRPRGQPKREPLPAEVVHHQREGATLAALAPRDITASDRHRVDM